MTVVRCVRRCLNLSKIAEGCQVVPENAWQVVPHGSICVGISLERYMKSFSRGHFRSFWGGSSCDKVSIRGFFIACFARFFVNRIIVLCCFWILKTRKHVIWRISFWFYDRLHLRKPKYQKFIRILKVTLHFEIALWFYHMICFLNEHLQ